MNTEITKEKRKELLAWLKRHEEYTRENTIEEVNINLATNGSDVIITTNKNILKPQGRVKIELDMWLKGWLNKYTKEQEFKVEFPMIYLENNGIYKMTYYHKHYSSSEINKSKLVNEIIEQTKALLNKENLTINDFYGVNGYGEIVDYLDEKGRKNWDLINVNICGVNELRTCKYDDEDNKKIIDKEIFDLKVDDTDKIIEELEIDTTTSLGKNKINIVRLFSENKINFEFFMYRGYNFESIDAQVYVDSSKDMVRAINELIEVMSIKPKFIDYMGEMAVIKFIPNERFYFRRWVDYLLLLISFIEYLESISIEGIHLEFDFSPFENEEFIKVNNDLEVRENVKFTKDLFSYTDR